MERKPLSKRTRFEVFKRDKFTCQYCGKKSPDVILQVDHVEPVAKGGGDDLLNLVTSCQDCNAGKSDKLLTDDAAVSKARAQMDLLADKREQFQMLLDWRRELKGLKSEQVEALSKYWLELIGGGFSLNDYGCQMLTQLISKYGANLVITGMEESVKRHFKIGESATHEQANSAFNNIEKQIQWIKLREKNPELAELLYIRGILKRKLYYCNPDKAMTLLKEAVAVGVDLPRLKEAALSATNWTNWQNEMSDLIGDRDPGEAA